VGAATTAAVLVTVRTLTSETLARRAAPFLVLSPAAVWAGTSADGYFAAVAARAVVFLALVVIGHRPRTTAFAAGLLLGLTVHLSYGLTLFAVMVAAVLFLGARRRAVLPYVIGGLCVVPAAFTAVGFDWWEAYRLLVERCHQGAGGFRPYGYWVWADLACTVLVVGPARWRACAAPAPSWRGGAPSPPRSAAWGCCCARPCSCCSSPTCPG
jgi:hypothetical protein